jgi:hypothetical protein
MVGDAAEYVAEPGKRIDFDAHRRYSIPKAYLARALKPSPEGEGF